MKANELMIGDWVRAPKNADGDFYAAQVSEIKQGGEHYYCYIPGPDGNDSIRCDDLSPVPLTQEILEKNGFKKDINGDFELVEEEYGVRVVRRGDVYAFTLATTRGGITDMFRFTLHRVGPFSVHWLQHALRLCGIEKEITI